MFALLESGRRVDGRDEGLARLATLIPFAETRTTRAATFLDLAAIALGFFLGVAASLIAIAPIFSAERFAGGLAIGGLEFGFAFAIFKQGLAISQAVMERAAAPWHLMRRLAQAAQLFSGGLIAKGLVALGRAHRLLNRLPAIHSRSSRSFCRERRLSHQTKNDDDH